MPTVLTTAIKLTCTGSIFEPGVRNNNYIVITATTSINTMTCYNTTYNTVNATATTAGAAYTTDASSSSDY